MYASAESPGENSADRVRRSTSPLVNREIDHATDESIEHFRHESQALIRRRIRQLDEEWDVERVLEVNAASLALSGLALGLTVNRRWLALPAVVMAFLFQHGVQGWCPPLPVLRRLGIRTRGEIDREKYALKELLEQP